MKTPVQNLIRRPSRSAPVIVLGVGKPAPERGMAEWNILSSQQARLHDHRVASGTSNGLFCGRMWSVHDSSCPVAGGF